MKKNQDGPIATVLVTFTVIVFLAAFAWKAVSTHLRDKFKGTIFFFVESLDAAADAQSRKPEPYQSPKK
jgi:hypothetical protein